MRTANEAIANQRPNQREQMRRERRRKLLLPIALVAAAIVVVVAVAVTHPSLLAPQEETKVEDSSVQDQNADISQPKGLIGLQFAAADSPTLLKQPYDWSNLDTSSSYYSYAVDGNAKSVLGIDVSQHQGDIDWEKVKAAGIQFVYLRVGYRESIGAKVCADSNFKQNLSNAKAAGLKVGVYFYSQATTEDEAREEADLTLQMLDGASIDYPVAFDFEPTNDSSGTRVSNLSADQMTKVAKAFCNRIWSSGYSTIIYGNSADLSLYNLSDLAKYGFWYAEYGSHPTMDLNFALWQYTDEGTVDGIEGNVDIDLDLSAANDAISVTKSGEDAKAAPSSSGSD